MHNKTQAEKTTEKKTATMRECFAKILISMFSVKEHAAKLN